MSTLQQEARALGDPTRYEIFRYVADAGRGVGVAELTEHVGLNHNAVRQHLAKLVSAELLTEGQAAPTGRGRPRLLYEVHPAAESRWGVAGPYERLSRWLGEVVSSGDRPVEVGRRVGARRHLGSGDAVDPVMELVDQMRRDGFDPAVRRQGEIVDITLRTCPFVTAALSSPDAVCELHLGIAEGIADRLGGLVIDGLVPKDPRQANCRLRCHREPGEA